MDWTLDWTGLDWTLDWTGLDSGLDSGLVLGEGRGCRGLVFLVSFLVRFCLYFSVFITNNHPRSIVNTAVFGAISL